MLFAKGLAFGFVLAATVGPMWVLCFRRTVASGTLVGLASGMGIAVADALYGAVAAFGLTAISGFLLGHRLWIGLTGAAFLVWLGVRALISRPVPLEAAAAPAPRGTAAAFLSTLGLTLANPPTILAFAAIFAGLGLASEADTRAAALVVAGVFLGSALWWLILVAGVGAFRRRIGPALARAINVVSGATILAFAAWQLAALARPFLR
jgi:threonine/homoserine/homoserine lactone efflux protein